MLPLPFTLPREEQNTTRWQQLTTARRLRSSCARRRARQNGRSHWLPTTRGAVACRHSHLNRDLARTLRLRTQIAILN